MAFVATVLALLSTVVERAYPMLVPASSLLGPISDAMADWNGLLNMVIAGVVNGAVYAAVFVAVAALTRRVRASTAR